MRPRYLRCRVLGPVHRLIRLFGATRAGLEERVAAALSLEDQQVVHQRLAQLDRRSFAIVERRLNPELPFWDDLVEVFGADRSEVTQVLPTRNKPTGLADDGTGDAQFCVEIELSHPPPMHVEISHWRRTHEQFSHERFHYRGDGAHELGRHKIIEVFVAFVGWLVHLFVDERAPVRRAQPLRGVSVPTSSCIDER